MPTTTAGTTYTITNFTSSYGEPASYAAYDGLTGAVPLVIYVHGNPSDDINSQDRYFTTLGSYATLRNWFIDNGWVIAECHGQGPNWGSTAGRQAYRALYNDIAAVYNVTDIVVLGSSMGGIIGSYLASRDPVIAPKCIGFIAHAGLMDLYRRYTIAADSSLYRINMSLAYGGSGVPGEQLTNAQFLAATVDHDPMRYAESVWTGRKVIQQYATGDIVVPPAEHQLPWLAKYGDDLALSQTSVTEGGDHTSASDEPAQRAASIAFVQSIWTAPVPFVARDVTQIRTMRNGENAPVTAVYTVLNGERRPIVIDQMKI